VNLTGKVEGSSWGNSGRFLHFGGKVLRAGLGYGLQNEHNAVNVYKLLCYARMSEVELTAQRKTNRFDIHLGGGRGGRGGERGGLSKDENT